MRLFRDPLIQFLGLGALAFAVYAVAAGFFSSGEVRRIEISAEEIEFLAAGFERQWGRPPQPQELQGLVDSRVREEVLYREALAVGLDRNDIVVRRRMVQKMELLSQDLALMADPTDEELRSFFEERREDYRIPPRLSFSHVYFNADRRGPATEDDARRVLAEIRAQSPPPSNAADRGDRFMLDYEFALASTPEIRRIFGTDFAEALIELEPGWHGPVYSGYGIHLVHVGKRVEGRLPEIEEVKERLITDFNRMRKERADKALYEGLAGRYEVIIGESTPDDGS